VQRQPGIKQLIIWTSGDNSTKRQHLLLRHNFNLAVLQWFTPEIVDFALPFTLKYRGMKIILFSLD